MKKLNILILLILAIGINSSAQKCLNSKTMLRGYFYAGTSQIDKTAAGGFYDSPNKPKKITPEIEEFSKKGELQIIVKKQETKNFSDDIAGFKVYIINYTDESVGLYAQDSRLYVTRQVYLNGKWNDIEYLVPSGCGNSYHKVIAEPNEYWEFVAPCLEGKREAKFRFKLFLKKGVEIYSNEFNGRFNRKQLRKRPK